MKGAARPRGAIAFAVVMAAIYVPKIPWGDAFVYRHVLTERVLWALAAACKLASLLFGCVSGLRVVRRTEAENPARSAWLLLSLWLGCFFAGQLVLSAHQLFSGQTPLASTADAFFLAGYALMIAAGVRFVVVYRASGYPVGTASEALAIVLGSVVVFGAIAACVLPPIVGAPRPAFERRVNAAYPVLDLVSLVPTLLLLRITSRFRGGRVWSVWASLLVGFAFATPGDILFAYSTTEGGTALESLIDPMFAVSYFFLARGAALQYRLLTD